MFDQAKKRAPVLFSSMKLMRGRHRWCGLGGGTMNANKHWISYWLRWMAWRKEGIIVIEQRIVRMFWSCIVAPRSFRRPSGCPLQILKVWGNLKSNIGKVSIDEKCKVSVFAWNARFFRLFSKSCEWSGLFAARGNNKCVTLSNLKKRKTS